ncbi:nuclear transport factor 2 family protein [Teredinibacter franksiae]|uniref:nuclear transport factor 2 family protein n=1 Tax=Teredinibacter franksiae TaxID=2761453 RepID=UPI001625D16F|nr:nuclear transport factor 2 family protein [Teredinibacter franksiae]
MMKIIGNIVLLALIGFLMIACNRIKTIDDDVDKLLIKEVIMEFYHEGHVTSDPKYYRQILHDDWKMFSVGDDGGLFQVDKSTYLSWYDPSKNDVSLNWKTEILYIDVSAPLASVKVNIGNQKFGYIDYFNMMKIEGKWWLVHKMSKKK